MMNIVSFFIATVCIPDISGFSPSPFMQMGLPVSNALQRTSTHSFTTCLHSSPEDKQAEIEALEEKLRQLKGEALAEQVVEPKNDIEPIQSTGEDEEELEWAVMKGQTNDSVMLSERWKEADPSSNSDGGMLKNVAIALGLLVFLGVFSQVPIGNEDLQRYQDYKGSASRIDLGDLNPDVRLQ
jgi:hypothetical protein